jgi:hypothetical protein
MPSLGGATEWLDSEPLGPAELRGPRRPRELDAAAESLPDDVIDYYVGMLSNPDSLRGTFGCRPRAAA